MKNKILVAGLCICILFAFVACRGGEEMTEDSQSKAQVIHGVVIGKGTVKEPFVTMLVDGKEETYEVSDDLMVDIEKNWDDYRYWGMYEGTFQGKILVKLAYAEGAKDIIGIFADPTKGKKLPDVISLEANTVTFIDVASLFTPDESEENPGYDSSSESANLTPEDGETFQLADTASVYLEGDDGMFVLGDIKELTKSDYEYVELYDFEGDGVFDMLIIWH